MGLLESPPWSFLFTPGRSCSFLACWMLEGSGRAGPAEGAGLLEKYEELRA